MMATRVMLNGNPGMRMHSKVPSILSDDEDGVQSGSATGFSDDDHSSSKPAHRPAMTFDPVTQILDKIDAELSSLTRSQSSSTATDSTVVRRAPSHGSTETGSRADNGDSLTMSQLDGGHKLSFSTLSSGSRPPGSTDRDTGIGTATSSLNNNSFRSRSADERRPLDLEPGDAFKDRPLRSLSPDFSYCNGANIGQSDDDKSKRERQAASPFEAKHVDDKFKEIMQKRKGFLNRAGTDDDNQTIRTEDFVEKFQDTMVYSSADEAERIKNLEDDLHSDGGSDTDTLQQKLATLTRTPLPKQQVGGPGTPPVYPKPTPTSSLPRPSTRSSLKITPGHASDADSVMTEDFENRFKDMMVGAGGNNTCESDLDPGISDPIHTKVKQLLKATAKYKPKPDFKNKPHVRISPKPPQYQDQDKGEDSDDTLCSDKDAKVTSPRQDSRVNPENLDETHQEIVRESDRIRKEMERERRAKSLSPVRERSPTRTYLSVTSTPKANYSRDIGGKPDPGRGHSLSDEEKERTAELKATQNALEVTQSALYEARKTLKDTQAQLEDLRTQVMLAEYKRENTSKELGRLSDDLRRRKQEVQGLDKETRARREEMKQFDSIGFTKEEAVKIIEQNEVMKGKLRNLDAVHAERDELIQQLESAKQDLFQEQKRARTKVEELQEELENLTNTYEQTQTEKDESEKKLQKLEVNFKKMEKEKNELIQEKTRQYEEEREKNKSERGEMRRRNKEDVDELRQDVARLTNKVATLQDEVRAKEQINMQLRDQLLSLQQKEEQERVGRSSIIEEHKKTLQTLRKETDAAMVQLRESLFLEKQKTIDKLREELEQERREISTRAEERYEQQIIDQAAIIKAKTDELSHLSKLLDKLETEKLRAKTKAEDDVKIQIQEAVNRERQLLEEERDQLVRQEQDALKAEHRFTVKQLQEQLDSERHQRQTIEAKLKDMKNELEDVRNSNKTALHEKLIAVARAKELMRQEHQVELERVTEQLKNEHKKELEKLKETVRVQAEEIRQLREARMQSLKQQKDNYMSLDRTERTLINEINEECRKTSEVLGISPRKVSINSYKENGYVSTPPAQNNLYSANTYSTKSPTTSALANLRACNEELRMHVTDLQSELEVERSALNKAHREKDEAITALKRQMEREKEEEMGRLKERLVRGLSTNEYRSLLYTPDNDSVYRQSSVYKVDPVEKQMRQLSEQQQSELERLQREVNRLALNQNQMPNGAKTPEELHFAKKLSELQAKVKQLQDDNNNLRKVRFGVSNSSPDLTNPDLYQQPHHRKFTMRSPSPTREHQRLASALELRLKEHELETEALTDHQRRSRDVMSRKMAEMTKLQNTLTNQAKELIQLEKAYTQLNNSARGRPPLR